MNIYSNYDKNAPSIGERGLLYGYIGANVRDKHKSRINDFLYSRDLIQLGCCNDAIPVYYGGDVSNVLMMPKNELIGKKNILTKMRFVLTNEDPSEMSLSPIRYHDDVLIEFNPPDDPESRRLSHNKKLQVSPLKNNDIFKIYSASDHNDKDIIHVGDKIIIARSVKDDKGKNKYLVVDNNYSVGTGGSLNDATQFTINGAIGCGPNWFYDQDTRELKGQQFSQSDVRDLAMESLDALTSKLKKQEADLTAEEKQFQQQCQEKISREQRINDQLKAELSQLQS